MWNTVRRLAESGTTVLLTTQYLDEAEHLADRIAILHGGRIIQDGTLDELSGCCRRRASSTSRSNQASKSLLALVGEQVPTAAEES